VKILAFHAHGGDPLSFLIKAETRSQYCHGAILIDSPIWKSKIASEFLIVGSGHLIVEAYWPKVRARLLMHDELDGIDVFNVPAATEEIEGKAMEWLIDQVHAGVKYDIPDLFRFVPQFRALLGETKDDAYKRHTFCSMLVFNAYRFAGLKLLNCHDYEYSPDKLPWSPLAVPAAKLS
jgi:hypothetical protein